MACLLHDFWEEELWTYQSFPRRVELKGIVHPKMCICWTLNSPSEIQARCQTCSWHISGDSLRNGSLQTSTQKASRVRTLWAQYEVMYVGAGGHAGPQTALLNHSSRGHHLYMHHLGTHEITSLTLHSRTDADTTFEGCEAEHECELCPRPVYVCVCLGDIPDPQCCRRCFSSCLTPAWPPSRPENWTP